MKKSVLSCVVFGIIFTGIFVLCSHILLFKSTEIMSKDYHRYGKNRFDIIFAGSSIMKNGIYPMDLWKKYGYSSYNLASGSQSIPTSYYIIKEAVREQKPNVVVLDCFCVILKDAYLSNEHLHFVTDQMCNKEKKELVEDFVPAEERMEFLFRIMKYHNRWKELEKEDLTYSEHMQYGAKVNFLFRQLPIEKEYQITTAKRDLPNISKEYLEKIIRLCKENHIRLLLTTMPVDWNADHEVFGNLYDKQAYYNGIAEIAEKYQINYLNFDILEREVGLDITNDYADIVHLNAYGAAKMTSYIGSFIKENYDVPDRRGDSSYDFLKEDYEEYSRYKRALRLSSETDLQKYIQILKEMDGITVVFSVKDIQGYSLTPGITADMKELGFRNADILLEKCYHSFAGVISEGKNIAEKIGRDEEIAEYRGYVGGKQIDVESRTLVGGDKSVISVDGLDYSMNMRGFNIVVIENATGEIMDSVSFDTHTDELNCCR